VYGQRSIPFLPVYLTPRTPRWKKKLDPLGPSSTIASQPPSPPCNTALPLRSSLVLGQNLNTLNFTIRLASINLLPRLLDSLQHGLVIQIWSSDDGCGLRIQGDIVGLDA